MNSLDHYSALATETTTGSWVQRGTSLFGVGKTIVTLSKGMKGHVTELVGSGKMLLGYARDNDIELPEDSTEQFSEMVSWEDAG
jgi:hypothetical protein